MKELRIWLAIAPFVAAVMGAQYKAATNFDANEIEISAFVGALLRLGAWGLHNRHIRAIMRDFIDSFEKGERDAQP